jgi:formylglycine-generating enzyme required for sulfatase activity
VNPVEQVSWHDANTVLGWLGFSLPTEAQWEYGARGGTTTPWSTGSEEASLMGYVNLMDRTAEREHVQSMTARVWSELDDGWGIHAPVGSFRPNPFGLHDVHGNVWEWCLDGYDEAFYAASPRHDPCAPWRGGNEACVGRGGSYLNLPSFARSAARNPGMPQSTIHVLGLRPARALVRE